VPRSTSIWDTCGNSSPGRRSSHRFQDAANPDSLIRFRPDADASGLGSPEGRSDSSRRRRCSVRGRRVTTLTSDQERRSTAAAACIKASSTSIQVSESLRVCAQNVAEKANPGQPSGTSKFLFLTFSVFSREAEW
jgi:hypothetical protein